jgi:pyruvate,water dikinase
MSYYGWPPILTFDEETDLEVTKCWFLVTQFSIPVKKPLSHWLQMTVDMGPFSWAAEQIMLPTAKGLYCKSRRGLFYSGLRPTSEAEEKAREPAHTELMRPWIEDFEGIWRGKLIPELKAQLQPGKTVDLQKITNVELEEYLYVFFNTVLRRIIQIHHLALYAAFTAYNQFVKLCDELIGVDEQDPDFSAVMTAFPTIVYEVDRQLQQLANRAADLNLEALFQATPENDALLGQLADTAKGRKWLGELDDFLKEHGWRTNGMQDICIPSWIEQPALALPAIRGNLAKGRDFLMDQEHDRLARERERAEQDLISRVPPENREWFQKLMRAAQWAPTFNEEHTYYIELTSAAVGRRLLMEAGRRAEEAKVLEEADDINFLMPEELTWLLYNMETVAYRRLAAIRRQEYEEYCKEALKTATEEPFIGDLEWGLKNMRREPTLLTVGGAQQVREELKADLYGVCGTLGSAEGVARVLHSPSQLSELEVGEILVVPSSNPGWNAAFNFIAGLVTDVGGPLSHALIVAREYGLPCVSGTRDATVRIKNGDIIRVDGPNKAVYVLKRP